MYSARCHLSLYKMRKHSQRPSYICTSIGLHAVSAAKYTSWNQSFDSSTNLHIVERSRRGKRAFNEAVGSSFERASRIVGKPDVSKRNLYKLVFRIVVQHHQSSNKYISRKQPAPKNMHMKLQRFHSYEQSLKVELLQYASAMLLLSRRGIDNKIINWNKVL